MKIAERVAEVLGVVALIWVAYITVRLFPGYKPEGDRLMPLKVEGRADPGEVADIVLAKIKRLQRYAQYVSEERRLI